MEKNEQNKLLFYFLIFISLFIIVFFTKDIYSKITENKDILEIKNSELSDRRTVLTNLEALNKKIIENKGGEEDTIKKYIHEIKEDELIEWFYSYVNNNRNGSGYILIDSISFDKGSVNEYGFKEGGVSLSLTVSDEQKMFEMLDFVTSPESRYQFFMNNFSFPNNKSEGAFQINFPLRIFYK